MNALDRFTATLDRRPVDRPAAWLGIPAVDALPGLYDYFGVQDMMNLKAVIGDDIWPVEVPYNHPPANHIACAFDFAKDRDVDYRERTLTDPGWFEDRTDPACVDDFPWPDPAEHMTAEACLAAVREVPDGYVRMGIMWSSHFQDALAAFGMENALITMLTAPEMFRVVIDRILEFYLQASEIFFEATKGELDAVLIGNDFGSQRGLIVSPESLREFAYPGTRRLVELARRYGLRVIHHSCGAIRRIIPDLIDCGVDSIHPIQSLAVGMEPQGLKDDFGARVSFCGGVDAQELLVNGTPEQVRARVLELRKIFPTGLIISPSHEAILPDIPPANIEAMFEAVKLETSVT